MAKAKTTGTYVAIAIAAVAVVLLVLFRSVAVEAVYPVERVERLFVRKVWTRVTGFFNGAAVRAENVGLRREVAALAMLKGDVERLEGENARLRRALDYAARQSGQWLAASVLSAGGGAAGAGDTIRVDKGSLAGIRVGAVVAVPDGLVGRVVSVTLHTSEIALITDRAVKVACEVEAPGVGIVRGVLSGGGEDALLLKHLSGAAAVPPRSRVLTSGRGGVFPRGIEVGTLLAIREDSKGLAREGEVLPAVDYSSLEDVFIRREK